MDRPLRILLLETPAITAAEIEQLLYRTNVQATVTGITVPDPLPTIASFTDYDLLLVDTSFSLKPDVPPSALVQIHTPEIPYILIAGEEDCAMLMHALQNGAADVVYRDHLDRLSPAIQRTIHQIQLQEECWRMVQEREITVELLRLINDAENRHTLMQTVTGYLQQWSGCEAVGVRLREGDDYPYYETRGFSEEFILTETSLCVATDQQDILRSVDGTPVLACMCGNVLQGRVDPAQPFFTSHGSFWTNSTSLLLAHTTEEERQAQTRNRCHAAGYESVALIPLRAGKEIFGLLQMNDRHCDRFTRDRIALFERLADSLALGLAQQYATQTLHHVCDILQPDRQEHSVQITMMHQRLQQEIATHRQTMATLCANEERLRAGLEGSNVGLWDWNIVTGDVIFNRHWGEILGYAPDEPEPHVLMWEQNIHPEDNAHVMATLNTHLAGETPFYESTYRLRAKSGEWHWIFDRGQVISRGADGTPLRAVGLHLDVTAQKQAELALKASEQKFSALFHFLPVPAAINAITDGKYQAVNEAFEEITGYSRDEVVGHAPDELGILLPEQQQQALEKLFREGCLRNFEAYFHKKSGERRTGLFAVEIIEIDGEQFILTSVNDVTDMKNLEAELQQANQALEQRVEERTTDLAKEHAYRTVAIDILPLVISFIDTAGNTVQMNKAGVRLLQQLGASDSRDVIPLQADTRSPLLARHWPTSRALQGKIITAQELILQGPNGVTLPVLVHAAPIKIDKQIVAAVCVVEDITALKDADRAKDEFLALLSHELQTPLTSILGWSDFALSHDNSELVRQAMQVVHRNARRQQTLIADMLDMSRLIHRKFDINLQSIDLRQQVIQAVENVQLEAERRGIVLKVHCNGKALPIQADPLRLQQCIGNLLQNSLKFTPQGGVVTISCRQKSATAVLNIEDTGFGIEPDLLETIFTPFRQLKRNIQGGGLGLGLALVRGIVELHGGRVSAASTGVDQGSVFTIELPLY
ncbi:MAG: sensor histidine kinase [Armatimonadota bacterium]